MSDDHPDRETTEGRPGLVTSVRRAQFCVPRVPDGFVPRDRLTTVLDNGVDKGMVIVSAPAGSGNTLLLAWWAARRPTTPAWLSVEPEDADPAHFWARVLSSLQTAPGLPPNSSLATMRVPLTFDPRFVTHLLHACDELPGTRVLVVDDLHLLTGTAALVSLSGAVRRGLGSLRLVISTRTDPVLPLQRLRLSDELTEIHTADLRFDAAEAERLLACHGVHLRPDQLRAVLAKTEGWAAGLRLAALSLQGRGDLDQAVEDLAGEQRTVADYFVEEVLGRQTEELTGFLLDTCVVRRVSADLANALTGRTDGRRMLAQLERENLFLVALDDRRTWYRYHRLFGDLLRHRLAAEEPERQAELHRRAASWLSAHGQVLEAARHLGAAEDWHGLARFVLRSAGAEMLGVDRHGLAELVRRVPADAILHDPEVSTAAAVASYAEYDAAGVRAHVGRARAALDGLSGRDAEITDAVITTLEAVAAWIEADAYAQINAASAALKRLDRITPAELPALPAYRAGAAIVLAAGKLWSGQLDGAEALLTRTMKAVGARTGMGPVLSVHLHGSLAVLKALRGRMGEASTEADIAMTVAEQSGWLLLPQSAMAFLAKALLHLARAEPDSCSVAIERGRACVGDLRDRFTVTGLALVRARLEVSAGNSDAARSAMRTLRDEMEGCDMPMFLRRWCALVDAEIGLAEEDVGAALRALDCGTTAGERPELHRTVLLARAALAANHPAECLEILRPLTRPQPEDLVSATDAWLLSALAHDRLRQDADAMEALGRALDLAAPDGIARPFVLMGARVTGILERYQHRHLNHRPFVATLLVKAGAFPSSASPPRLLAPLTNRERSVLMLLPTMMSNNEIADELYVSVNTVKVHLKSLYRKLGVSNRREAVTAARSLGLMSAVDVRAPA